MNTARNLLAVGGGGGGGAIQRSVFGNQAPIGDGSQQGGGGGDGGGIAGAGGGGLGAFIGTAVGIPVGNAISDAVKRRFGSDAADIVDQATGTGDPQSALQRLAGGGGRLGARGGGGAAGAAERELVPAGGDRGGGAARGARGGIRGPRDYPIDESGGGGRVTSAFREPVTDDEGLREMDDILGAPDEAPAAAGEVGGAFRSGLRVPDSARGAPVEGDLSAGARPTAADISGPTPEGLGPSSAFRQSMGIPREQMPTDLARMPQPIDLDEGDPFRDLPRAPRGRIRPPVDREVSRLQRRLTRAQGERSIAPQENPDPLFSGPSVGEAELDDPGRVFTAADDIARQPAIFRQAGARLNRLRDAFNRRVGRDPGVSEGEGVGEQDLSAPTAPRRLPSALEDPAAQQEMAERVLRARGIEPGPSLDGVDTPRPIDTPRTEPLPDVPEAPPLLPDVPEAPAVPAGPRPLRLGPRPGGLTEEGERNVLRGFQSRLDAGRSADESLARLRAERGSSRVGDPTEEELGEMRSRGFLDQTTDPLQRVPTSLDRFRARFRGMQRPGGAGEGRPSELNLQDTSAETRQALARRAGGEGYRSSGSRAPVRDLVRRGRGQMGDGLEGDMMSPQTSGTGMGAGADLPAVSMPPVQAPVRAVTSAVSAAPESAAPEAAAAGGEAAGAAEAVTAVEDVAEVAAAFI